jgi:hypothetical protein
MVHNSFNNKDLQLLRDGVVITAVAQEHDGKNSSKPLTAPTAMLLQRKMWRCAKPMSM